MVMEDAFDNLLRIRDEAFKGIRDLDTEGKLKDCQFQEWIKDHSFEADIVDSEEERRSKFHQNLKGLGYTKSQEGYKRLIADNEKLFEHRKSLP